jgi:hypothetical protein
LRDKVRGTLRLEGERLEYFFAINNVESGCAWAVALLLDQRYGLTNRLRQCGWSRCGRFRVDLAPRGRPRRFCSDEHKRLYDLETSGERVRRSRARTGAKR